MLYLASMLGKQRKLGLPKTADVMLEDPNIDGSRERISRFGPDVFGVTAYELNLDEVRELLAAVKELDPGTSCFVGGPAATSVPDYVLHFTGADAVFLGEADLTFRKVIEHLDSGGKLRDVDAEGVLVRDGDNVEGNRKKPFLPQDVYEAIEPDMGLIAELHSVAGYHAIDFSFSRGCPAPRCTFCQISPVSGHRRLSDEKAVRIMKEIATFCRRAAMTFGDGTFGGGKEGAKSLLSMMEREGIHFPLMFAEVSVEMLLEDGELGPRKADTELMRMMRDANLCFEVGIDNLTENQLKKFNKFRYTFDEICRMFEGMREAGLHGYGGIHLAGTDTVCEDVVECMKRAFEIKNRFGRKIIDVSDTVTPFVGTGEYRKFMRFADDDNSAAAALLMTFQELGYMTDISEYEPDNPFLLRHTPVIRDQLLFKVLFLDYHARMLAACSTPDLITSIELDEFNMLLRLLEAGHLIEYHHPERAALGWSIEDALSEAAKDPDVALAASKLISLSNEIDIMEKRMRGR